jgi:tetratricopeptide (TPR) repeat protein
MARAALAAVLLLAALGCQASSGAFDRGQDRARSGDWDAAVRYYERALAGEPDNVEYRIALERARLEASRFHLRRARSRAAAGDVEGAVEGFELALGYDPTNRYAHAELDELRGELRQPVVGGGAERVAPFPRDEPILDPDSDGPIHVKFPEGSSLRTVLESLAELAGVNILFDESFRDKRVAVDLEGVTYREALDILMITNGLFYKVVSSSTVLVER